MCHAGAVIDRYGSDILRAGGHPRRAARTVPIVSAEAGLVVECAGSGFCGAVIGFESTSAGAAVVLEDRHGARRLFPLQPAAFLLEGDPVTLARPASPVRTAPQRSASGSTYVADAAPRTARASRIWVEGVHDAELIERVWGHDLRVEGVVVEPLHGADDLLAALDRAAPGDGRRIGVLLDHLVAGSKESRLAEQARAAHAPHVEVVGHPFVDVWQAVRPQVLGIPAWPVVPRGVPWKSGVVAALGWGVDEATAWRRILASVGSYADLDPHLSGRVERLIDFVTQPG